MTQLYLINNSAGVAKDTCIIIVTRTCFTSIANLLIIELRCGLLNGLLCVQYIVSIIYVFGFFMFTRSSQTSMKQTSSELPWNPLYRKLYSTDIYIQLMKISKRGFAMRPGIRRSVVWKFVNPWLNLWLFSNLNLINSDNREIVEL